MDESFLFLVIRTSRKKRLLPTFGFAYIGSMGGAIDELTRMYMKNKSNSVEILKHLEAVADTEGYVTVVAYPRKGDESNIPQVLRLKANKKSADRVALINEGGCNVSVIPQLMKGNGASKKNVVAIRYLVMDIDRECSKEELQTLKCRPQLIIQSSPGRYHLYFSVSSEVANFVPFLKAFVKKYDADKEAAKITQAFKLAGSYNWKYDIPTFVRILQMNEVKPVAIEKLARKMGVKILPEKAKPSSISVRSDVSGEPSEDALRRALENIPSDDRKVWLDIGMALHSWSGTSGRRLWEEWSAKSGKYEKGDQDRTWRNFKASGKITVRTVFHYEKIICGKTTGQIKKGFPVDEPDVAEYIAMQLKDCLRIDENDDFWVYSDNRWNKDFKKASRMVGDHIKRLCNMAIEEGTDHEKNRLKGQLGFSSFERIAKLLRDFATLDIQSNEFNKNPLLLGVKNGVVDLSTGTFRAGEPSDMISICTNVEYDAKADYPEFRKFLISIAPTQELRTSLRHILGYLLLGHQKEQKAFIMIGKGSNGKGTLMRLMESILGKHYCTSLSPMFMKNATRGSANGPTPAMMPLKNARMIICSETERKGIDRVFFKTLTGNDTMSGRQNYGEQESFKVPGTLVITTNEMPEWPYDDDSLWRRIVVIPFLKSFNAENGRNNDLDEILAKEASGILRWLISGAKEYERKGLYLSEEIEIATRGARTESDSVKVWLDDQCELKAGSSTPAKTAYDSYTAFTQLRKLPAISVKAFKASLKRKGVESKRKAQGNCFENLNLVE